MERQAVRREPERSGLEQQRERGRRVDAELAGERHAARRVLRVEADVHRGARRVHGELLELAARVGREPGDAELPGAGDVGGGLTGLL